MTLLSIRIVRAPGSVRYYVALVIKHFAGIVKNHAVFRQRPRRVAQPAVARPVVKLLQIDNEVAAVARQERAVDQALDVGEIVAGQPGDTLPKNGL
jgi:hypothetical protein